MAWIWMCARASWTGKPFLSHYWIGFDKLQTHRAASLFHLWARANLAGSIYIYIYITAIPKEKNNRQDGLGPQKW
jgi:hypothetical protein